MIGRRIFGGLAILAATALPSIPAMIFSQGGGQIADVARSRAPRRQAGRVLGMPKRFRSRGLPARRAKRRNRLHVARRTRRRLARRRK